MDLLVLMCSGNVQRRLPFLTYGSSRLVLNHNAIWKRSTSGELGQPRQPPVPVLTLVTVWQSNTAQLILYRSGCPAFLPAEQLCRVQPFLASSLLSDHIMSWLCRCGTNMLFVLPYPMAQTRCWEILILGEHLRFVAVQQQGDPRGGRQWGVAVSADRRVIPACCCVASEGGTRMVPHGCVGLRAIHWATEVVD